MTIERLEQITKPKDKELVVLLQELVRTPSWVPSDEELKSSQNENEVVDYLEDWLRKNTDMDLHRQSLEGGRFNLIASKGRPDLVFLAHTDTVQPSENAPYNQLAAEIHDGKVWGRGTTDMKSGIATMSQALALSPNTENVWMFLYADEEYDFLGMKGLVEDYGDLRPKLLVSSDGSDLAFGHGCRGLIEFRGRFHGETGHPARGTGNNAIEQGMQSLFELRDFTFEHSHPNMGDSSFNVAHVLGGARLPDSVDNDGRLARVGQAGNVVPDVMDFVVDIRPATPDLTARKTMRKLEEYAAEKALDLEITEETHQLGAWYTNLKDVHEYLELAKEVIGASDIKIDDPGGSGYLDLQMLWETTGKPPAFMFGGGVGDTAHAPEEHIGIEELIKTRDFFQKVLEKHSKS